MPPGFATAVWLPSGLALLGVLTLGWPAVMTTAVASFLLNLWTYTDSGIDLGLALSSATAVAGGAAVQAWVGARLGRTRAARASQGGTANLLWLLALSGPLSCLISATWALFWLASHELIAADQWLNTWATWWVGDSIGVLLVMTLYLAAHAGKQRQVVARLCFVGVPMALAMLSSIMLFYRSSALEQQALRADFRDRVQTVTRAFETGVSRYADALQLLRIGLAAQRSESDAAGELAGVSAASFHRLAQDLLPRYPGIQAIEWIPLVRASDRATFEAEAKQSGRSGYSVHQQDSRSGVPLPASERGFFHAVRYVEPLAGNAEILGFDLASDSRRLTALRQATHTGHVTATSPVSIFRASSSMPGTILLLPVWLRPPTLAALQSPALPAPTAPIRGHLAVVFVIRTLLETTIGPWLTGDLNLEVYAQSSGNQLIFNHSQRGVSKEARNFRAEFISAVPGVDGLNWRFVVRPTASYLAAHRSLQSWGGLAASLVGAACLGVFLIVLNGRNEALAFEVTERRRIEHDLERNTHALEDARDAAESASRAKSAFLANMSHEIRTPLGAVLGFSELVCHADLASGERDRYLAAIQRNGAQLSGIINDILDISKVEAGKLDLTVQTAAVDEIMKDMSSYLQLQAADKGIGLNLHYGAGVPRTIRTDPLRLRQILLNIVGNAIKFTSRGQVDVRLEMAAGATGATPLLQISVCDSGPGISDDEAAKLFSPFTQVDNSAKRQHGGTGLGLVLSRRLAQMLGGDVRLTESLPGRGSTFVISIDPGPLAVGGPSVPLPTKRRGAAGAQAKAQDPSAAPAAPRLEGVRVLLVDDAPDNRLLVGRYLRSAGALVETAENGREAVDKAWSREFDTVLMDLQMPLMDGYEATAELRRLGYRRTIIALTAHAMKEERERCLGGGFDDHLSKPVDRRTLIATIQRFMASGSNGDSAADVFGHAAPRAIDRA